jgi:hypothetical protein
MLKINNAFMKDENELRQIIKLNSNRSALKNRKYFLKVKDDRGLAYNTEGRQRKKGVSTD